MRADFSVYQEPWSKVCKWPDQERLAGTAVVGEVKRENADKKSAIDTQLKPALSLLPDMNALGVYWDDLEQRFFYREMAGSLATIREAPISKIPRWMEGVGPTFLTFRTWFPQPISLARSTRWRISYIPM